MTGKRLLAFILMATVLAACAPTAQQVQQGPVVALINAPADIRVTTAAQELEEEVGRLSACCQFTFRDPAAIRFQETHRNMFGSQAAPQAASLARNLGSDLAVMAGAPRFERVVEDVDGGRDITATVQLRATVVDAETEAQLGTVMSPVFRGERFLPEGEELPPEHRDPTLLNLVAEAARDLAPGLTSLLNDLAADYR